MGDVQPAQHGGQRKCGHDQCSADVCGDQQRPAPQPVHPGAGEQTGKQRGCDLHGAKYAQLGGGGV